MVVTQELVKEVNSLLAHEALIISSDERVPRLAGKARKDLVVLRIQLDIVLVQVLEKLFRSENFGNLDQLIRIAIPVEKGLLAEDHRSEHRAQ